MLTILSIPSSSSKNSSRLEKNFFLFETEEHFFYTYLGKKYKAKN